MTYVVTRDHDCCDGAGDYDLVMGGDQGPGAGPVNEALL